MFAVELTLVTLLLEELELRKDKILGLTREKNRAKTKR